jgi:hypothetical protein
MGNTIYVVGEHAYRSREQLEACEALKAEEAEHVAWLGLPPRYLFRVHDETFEGLTTDPVQVSHWTRCYPDAEVTIIPIS